jgi:hypothetical protein
VNASKCRFGWLSFFIFQVFFSCLLCAQNTEGPQLPPVNVEFKLMNTPQVGGDAEIKLIVTPQEDMHIDISVLVPEGLKARPEDGFPIMPQNNASMNPVSSKSSAELINFWVGPVKAKDTKEYVFHIKISEQGKHSLVAQIRDLMQYGVKQEVLEI